MAEVEIDNVRYMINKMNVFDQAHVARKVAPIWFSMGRGFAAAVAANQALNGEANGVDEEDGEVSPGTMFEVMMPLSEILAKMSDEDVDYVLKKCLSVCARWNGQTWTRMMQGGTLMFQDIDLGTLIQLTMSVVQDNLAPFLPGLLVQNSPTAGSTSQSNS
jgi:hypothetical protein